MTLFRTHTTDWQNWLAVIRFRCVIIAMSSTLRFDGSGRVLAEPILVSVEHEDGTAQIDAGAIFREALKAGAEEVVVAHNHPSGDLTPSKADIAATKKLREAGELLSIPLLDHLVLGKAAAGDGGPPAFVSLAERGGI